MSVGHTAVRGPVCVKDQECPVREVLDRVGDKWSVLVVMLLSERPHRFSELNRAIDTISQRMLTFTLRALVRDGLVSRTAYPTVPQKVEYALTDLGRTLLGPIRVLDEWAGEHLDAIRASRRRHDQAVIDELDDLPGQAVGPVSELPAR
ncbi:helix-turn-helix transcriptional regulator [Saccharothrix sp. 6-C]|nr:helix-turn-helix transcriptional regulator [Saccharothrix sp. 6-C]